MEILNHLSAKNFKQIAHSNNSFIYHVKTKTNTEIIVKHIPHTGEEHSTECKHLKNEANLITGVEHPNVIAPQSSFLKTITFNGKPGCALLLEYASADLFHLLEDSYPKLIDVKYFRKWFKEVATALKHLHTEKDIAHNDIKLENILLFGDVAKIADFGFSRKGAAANSKSFKSRWVRRSRLYLSPQALKHTKGGHQFFNEKSNDVFSLGVSLFSAIFLRSPFEEGEASETDPLFKHFHTKDFKTFWKEDHVASMTKVLKKFPEFRFEELQDLLQ